MLFDKLIERKVALFEQELLQKYYALSLAGERQIRVKADVRIPVLLTTPELDLCTIIGNLLDNAMEACMELPPEKRLIRIYMEMTGNFLP